MGIFRVDSFDVVLYTHAKTSTTVKRPAGDFPALGLPLQGDLSSIPVRGTKIPYAECPKNINQINFLKM